MLMVLDTKHQSTSETPGIVSRQGREERRDKRFQARAEEPLGIETHNTMSKRSSEWWLLIGQKNALLLCPIGEQHLLSSFAISKQGFFVKFVHLT